MDSDDELLTLSSHALGALQEFKKEETDRIKAFESLNDKAQKDFDAAKNEVSIDLFQEDWQLSQFWYTDETSLTLAKALLEGADDSTVIAIASAPAVYAAIKKMDSKDVPTNHIYLLEYDTRFNVLAGNDHFAQYDYNYPDQLPNHLLHKCHRLLIDPPFLEEDCQAKSAAAAHNLLVTDKTTKTSGGDLQYKLVSSTGERMKSVIKANYPDTSITTFYPEHKNGLSNEFRCYASFECSYWKFDSNQI